jgi:hypothetical protein
MISSPIAALPSSPSRAINLDRRSREGRMRSTSLRRVRRGQSSTCSPRWMSAAQTPIQFSSFCLAEVARTVARTSTRIARLGPQRENARRVRPQRIESRTERGLLYPPAIVLFSDRAVCAHLATGLRRPTVHERFMPQGMRAVQRLGGRLCRRWRGTHQMEFRELLGFAGGHDREPVSHRGRSHRSGASRED